ncbi:MAG: peptide chain release factor N(5)-glutamine methyltransferase [Tissierellia bacterium]|nr:peptide chain release factor N(5)-glutamine methyltransferase [Tissierellia bacterium]
MVIKELLKIGRDTIKDTEYTNGLNESRQILSFLLKVDNSYLYAYSDEEVSEKIAEEFIEMAQKRSEGYPLQYLLGSVEFMGLEYQTSENVLIPRTDTEFLVERIISENKSEIDFDILEIGVGSGIISLTLGNEFKDSKVTGVDISDYALKLANKNKENLKIDNVRFIKSNLYENVVDKYDIIVSNPPYIPSDDIDGLQVEVAVHEPRIALDGGNDGLDFYREIIVNSTSYLKKKGKLYFEIGYNQGEDIKKLLIDNGFREVEIIIDFAGNDRVVRGEL